MVYPDTSREAQRAVERHGETVDITTYTQTGTDSYGDPEFSASTTTGVAALVSQPDAGVVTRSDAGADLERTVVFRIPDDNTVNAPSDGHPKPDRITRTRTSTDYRVQTVVDNGSGLLEVTAVQEER